MYVRASAAAWVVALTVGIRPALGAAPEAPSSSDSAPPPASAAPAIANVSVHGSSEERAALADILRDLLANRASLNVSAGERVDAARVLRASRSVTPDHDIVAWVWIELDAEQVALYVTDSEGARILVRRVQRANTPSEVVLESAARVAVTAIEALLQGEPIGVPRDEVEPAPLPTQSPPKVATTPKRKPARAPWLRWRAGAFYGVELFATKPSVMQGPGVLLGGSLGSGRLRLGATFSAQMWLPRSMSGSAVTLDLYSASPRVLVGADYAAGDRVALSAGLGGGLDFTRVQPTAAAGSQGVHAAAAETLVTAQWRAAAGASFRVANGLSIAVIGFVDGDLSGTRYVVDSAGAQAVFLRPWPVRPGLMLGVLTP